MAAVWQRPAKGASRTCRAMPGALLFQGEGDTNVGIGEARGSTASLMTTWRLLKRRAKADAFPL